MPIDINDFFRQATLRICGSLDAKTAMRNTLSYLLTFIPITGMSLIMAEPGLPAIITLAGVSRRRCNGLKSRDPSRPSHRKISMDAEHEWTDLQDSSAVYQPGGRQRTPIPQKTRADFERVWAELDDVLIVNQPADHPIVGMNPRLIKRPDVSIMFMPLKIRDRRLFALMTDVDGNNQYAREHAYLLGLLHDPFAIAMSNALRHEEAIRLKELLADDNRYLHQELLRISGDEIIGRDQGLKGVFDMVRQVAPLNSPVLLLGETGAGKEVVANAIHNGSPRRNRPFIKVNCGAIPETLIDSELFGHEKGAFTGAFMKKRGRFERAHKGTILLDEIGELPQEAQVRLLHVLQNKEIERVGGTDSVSVDIRVIASTHRDLEKMVRLNQFREDLWFRLHVFPIKIPPLRKRKEDIPDLVNYFIKRKSIEKNIPTPQVSPKAIDLLKAYHWPGNVRELENVVERALIQHQGQDMTRPMTFEDLFFKTLIPAPPGLTARDHVPSEIDRMIVHHIEKILKRALKDVASLQEGGNKSGRLNETDKTAKLERTISGHLNRIFIPVSGTTPLPQEDHETLPSPENDREPLTLDDAVSLHIQKVLKLTKGKIHGPGGAAELLDINPSTLRYKIQKLGLLPKKQKPSSGTVEKKVVMS